jgi:type IV pilus assembly protein PilN
MVSIDLRPWREERREERQKQFVSLIALIAILAGVVCFSWFWFMQKTIDNQQDRNNYITQKTAKLEVKIAEIKTLNDELERLKSRMKVVDDLQNDRPLVVHVFDQFVNTVAVGVYYKELSLKSNLISVKGIADKSFSLTENLKNIDASRYFSDATPQVISDTGESEGEKSFSATMLLVNPNKAKKEAE